MHVHEVNIRDGFRLIFLLSVVAQVNFAELGFTNES